METVPAWDPQNGNEHHPIGDRLSEEYSRNGDYPSLTGSQNLIS